MNIETSVVVHAPTGSDAPRTCAVLAEAGIPAIASATMSELIDQIRACAGTVVIGEEALTPMTLAPLVEALDSQPEWSDIPLIVLTGREFSTSATRPLNVLGPLRNVMLLERPARRGIFIRAVEVAMRSRRRQFELRAHLSARAELLRREQTLNRVKDEFLMTVSHELRTPLTAIVGWARMLATGEIRESQRQRALEAIERNASAQAQLVNDLLDVSRAISGKTRLHVRAVDLRSVVTAAVDTVQPAATTKRVRLSARLSEQAVPVQGDAERLQQIVWNLLSNAIKFTPSDGEVDVQVQTTAGDAEVVVRDTGLGISPEFLPYMFDSFRQGDAGTTRLAGGLGLGLAIVRHLVELHGGTVAAESEGPGRGATLRVHLPLAPSIESAASQSPPAEQRIASRLDHCRVVVIEDDADSQELFSTILERAGAEVRVAGTVADGMSLVEAFHPAVVLSDIEMPVADGYSLMRRLREVPNAPVAIALTAHARAEDRLRALDAGFVAHVAKPVDPAALLAAVTAALER